METKEILKPSYINLQPFADRPIDQVSHIIDAHLYGESSKKNFNFSEVKKFMLSESLGGNKRNYETNIHKFTVFCRLTTGPS